MCVGSEIIFKEQIMDKSYPGSREYNGISVKYDCYLTTPTQEREKKSVNIKYLMLATRKM